MTRPPKTRLKQVRSLHDLRSWWNTVVDVKVKAVVIAVLLAGFTFTGSQYQVQALNNARIHDVCVARIDTATNLNHTLKAIVDLSDLFPDSEGAEQYTASRTIIIDTLAPIPPEGDCQ